MKPDITFRRRHPRTDTATSCANETQCGAVEIMGFAVRDTHGAEVLCHDCLVEKIHEGGSVGSPIQ